MFDFQYIQDNQLNILIGTDEAGRGPLAGPVVAVAVALYDFSLLNLWTSELGINDSKKLTAKKRASILENLNIDVNKISLGQVYRHQGYDFCVWMHSSKEIDNYNILQSSLICMEKSCEQLLSLWTLESKKIAILIDGNKTFSVDNKSINDNRLHISSLVGGDGKSTAIALASIIAKEYRDFLMRDYHLIYPEYGFIKHSGYPTKEHRESIQKYGPSPIHRKTFKGVKEFCK